MVDVLAAPVDGSDDARGVEHRVTSLGECHSIAHPPGDRARRAADAERVVVARR
jgi:hypothetical protein